MSLYLDFWRFIFFKDLLCQSFSFVPIQPQEQSKLTKPYSIMATAECYTT